MGGACSVCHKAWVETLDEDDLVFSLAKTTKERELDAADSCMMGCMVTGGICCAVGAAALARPCDAKEDPNAQEAQPQAVAPAPVAFGAPVTQPPMQPVQTPAPAGEVM